MDFNIVWENLKRDKWRHIIWKYVINIENKKDKEIVTNYIKNMILFGRYYNG